MPVGEFSNSASFQSSDYGLPEGADSSADYDSLDRMQSHRV